MTPERSHRLDLRSMPHTAAELSALPADVGPIANPFGDAFEPARTIDTVTTDEPSA